VSLPPGYGPGYGHVGTPWYRCSCDGCWTCAGRVDGCTCDVDWERLYSDPGYRAPGSEIK
jgi:hypothetical protein